MLKKNKTAVKLNILRNLCCKYHYELTDCKKELIDDIYHELIDNHFSLGEYIGLGFSPLLSAGGYKR